MKRITILEMARVVSGHAAMQEHDLRVAKKHGLEFGQLAELERYTATWRAAANRLKSQARAAIAKAEGRA